MRRLYCSQCELEGIQLIQDQEDDEETWEDLLEDEEIVWDPTRERPVASTGANMHGNSGLHTFVRALYLYLCRQA